LPGLAAGKRVELTAEHVVMTVGAAGGLNVVLKSLLNPGKKFSFSLLFYGI
jgi:DNA-binding transcriptional MocR family regulator